MRIGAAAIMILVVSAGLWAAADVAFAAPAINSAVSVSETDAITIPRLISYQGKLLNASGNPVPDTTYSVSFRLYTVASGGSSFWNEDQPVRTKSGLFAVLLGSATPISSVPEAGTLFLGMKIGSDPEMAPRIQIGSAAYAYFGERAANADALQGKDTSALDGRYVNEGQANSVASGMIRDTNVTMAKIAKAGASSGQVIKWLGSAWAPGPDNTGGTSDSARVAANSYKLEGKDTTALDGRYVNEGQAAGGDLTGTYPNPTIAGNAVTSAKIQDGTIRGTDIAKPCTLSAATAGPLLYVNQTSSGNALNIRAGIGSGILVDSARHGLTVRRADSIGLHIQRTGKYGIKIDSTGSNSSGVAIGRVGTHGLYVVHAGESGTYVSDADWGYSVGDSVEFDGLWVRRAHQNGVHIVSAGSAGVQIDTAPFGLHVHRATTDGIRIDSTADDGIEVDSAGFGLFVPNARVYGVLSTGRSVGGYFEARNADGVGVFARACDGVSTDTAVRAIGRGIATGGWYTGLDEDRSAPGMVSFDRTIVTYGTGTLAGDQATISLPDGFAENLVPGQAVQVTVTQRGEPSGVLFTTNATASGFQVGLKKVAGWDGGSSEFDWVAYGRLKEASDRPTPRPEQVRQKLAQQEAEHGPEVRQAQPAEVR